MVSRILARYRDCLARGVAPTNQDLWPWWIDATTPVEADRLRPMAETGARGPTDWRRWSGKVKPKP